MGPRILCYAPYNRWALHGQWEMTILHSMRLRGAEVDYVLCDGLYTDCDQHWAAHDPRPANACALCQAAQTKLVAEMGMDFHWLGRYLTWDEQREARRWADALAVDELTTATYGDWQVAEWVQKSVQSHFRLSVIDPHEPRVADALRSYAYSGLVACFAIDRLLAERDPDVLFLFNGRQSSPRCALELARARGIRVIVHERGRQTESLMLVENANCLSLEPARRYWREWSEVPLTQDELEAVVRLMAEREHGRNLPWHALSLPPQPLDDVRAQLDLRADRPTWVLFTSSDDEVAGDVDWTSEFSSQRDWITRTIEHARRNPQLDLVVRVHPNTGSKRSTGVNEKQLAEMREIARDLPTNVRWIGPDEDVSSYTLMELAAVGLVWMSTAAMEMAVKGKEVVVAGGNPVRGTDFVHTVEDPDRFEALLDELNAVPAGAASPEIRRRALRFAYGFFIRLDVPFPLVHMPNPNTGVLQYRSLDALQPGRDASLDRCARILLDGEAVCPAPTEAELTRSTDAEDAFLAGFGRRRLHALAYADELVQDTALLRAWAETFNAEAATLLIHTPGDKIEQLVAAVAAAGLDGDDGPDLVATEIDEAQLAVLDAVLSRRPRDLDVPRYDEHSLRELAT